MSATKTPEQLAAELALRAGAEFCVSAHGNVSQSVLSEIPLAELLAVAMAAKKLRAEVGDLGKEIGGQAMDDAYEETKQSLTALEAKLPDL